MLQILFNDNYSQLSLIQNMNKEAIQVIDDDMKVYKSISFNPWEPEDEDIIAMWKESLEEYYQLKTDNPIWKEYRQSMFERSMKAFKQFLIDSKKTVKQKKFRLNKQLVIRYLRNYKSKILKDSTYYGSDASYIDNCILSLKGSK